VITSISVLRNSAIWRHGLCVLICVLVGAACVTTAQTRQSGSVMGVRTLSPVDEALSEPALAAIRARLVAALERKDLGTVASVLSGVPEPDRSPMPLVAQLAQDDEMQKGILEALKYGGAFTTERGRQPGRREFCAPYPYATYPNVGDNEPWIAEAPGIVLGRDVAVHERPTKQSPVIARLTHAIVGSEGTLVGLDDLRSTWVLITLPGPREGYVLDAEIWRPDEYHVCFEKSSNGWVVSTVGKDTFQVRRF
jgi:hypothetical protein